MQHQLTADPVRLQGKPESSEVGLIKQRMQRATVDTVRDFIEDIGAGVSWSGGIFEEDHLMNKNFISSSIVGLDFDSGLKPQEAIDRIKKYGLVPSCWYPSFSDDPDGKRKFRLVFFLDRAITDKNAHRALMNLFTKCYPELDRAATDASRFFYGTNSEGIILNDEEIPLDDLYTALSSHAISGGRLRQNGRNTKGGKALQQHVTTESVTYNNSKKIDDDSLSRRRYERLKKNLKNKVVDWDKLCSRVKLFDQFMNGHERLKYSQLEFIASNLAWMRGSKSIYKKRLNEFNENHDENVPGGLYEHDGRFELLRDFRQRNQDFETCYFPMNLSNEKAMAPKEDHRYKNLIAAERDQVKGVKITEPINRMTLPKAEQLFRYKFREVEQSWDTDIHVFLTATALGKTQEIKDAGPNTCLLFPTHQLRDEVWERRNDKYTAMCTPQLPTFESDELNNKLSRLYELGFNAKAHKEVVSVWKGYSDERHTRYDKELAGEYIKKKRELYVTDKTILGTHQWGIHAVDKLSQVDTVIFDECPASTLAPVNSVKISELTKMASKPLFKDTQTPLLDIVNYLISEVDEGEITQLPDKFDFDLEDHAATYSLIEGLSSNIVEFLQSDYIYKEKGNPDTVHFITQSYLPTDTKVIIMSATANVNYYKEVYGSRVQVHDISEIEQKGEIEQDLHKSYSRVSLKSSRERANELTADKPTITFMTEREHIDTAVDDIYFGNCSGYDSLKGESINILGTPHCHNSKVFLLAAVLGIPIQHEKNREFGRKNVEFNGMEFNFSTFLNNERLSKIQMELISAQLKQAVGRARTLREDCTVSIYSNFPLRMAAPNYHF